MSYQATTMIEPSPQNQNASFGLLATTGTPAERIFRGFLCGVFLGAIIGLVCGCFVPCIAGS